MREKLIFLTFLNEFYAFYLERKEVLGPISQGSLYRAAETQMYIFLTIAWAEKLRMHLRNDLHKG